MRITDNYIYQAMSAQLARATERMTQTQMQVSSNSRLLKPSDDPAASVRASELRSGLTQLTQQETSVKEGRAWLRDEESVFGSIQNLLRQARTTALAGASTQSDESRAALALQIEQMKQSLLSMANTSHGDRYLFGGFQTTAAPFTEAGGTVTYNGDSGIKTVTVAGGITLTFNHSGDEAFGMSLPGGSVFDTLDALSTAIRTDSQADIQTQLTALDAHNARFTGMRIETGLRLQQADLLNNQIGQQRTLLTGMLSETADVDLADALVQLQAQQNAFQAASYVAGIIGQGGLLKWLS